MIITNKQKTIFLPQVEQDYPVSESSPHIANIGRLVEDMENKIRNTLNEIYFGKTKDIVNGVRCVAWIRAHVFRLVVVLL